MRYDTEKAIEVGTYCSPGSTRDFHWSEETLYKTPRSHRFFLAGEGGALSRFAQRCDRYTRKAGSKIIPLEDEEARGWARKYLEEDIEEHFPKRVFTWRELIDIIF